MKIVVTCVLLLILVVKLTFFVLCVGMISTATLMEINTFLLSQSRRNMRQNRNKEASEIVVVTGN